MSNDSNTFIGGPFDGEPLDHDDAKYLQITFPAGRDDMMALYELESTGRHIFVGIVPKDGLRRQSDAEAT